LKQLVIRKHSGRWLVGGIENMSRNELNSCLDKLSHEQGFEPNLKIDVSTRNGIFGCLGADLGNDSVRQLIISQIGGA
jgi:hypothetical protein